MTKAFHVCMHASNFDYRPLYIMYILTFHYTVHAHIIIGCAREELEVKSMPF